MSAPVHDPGAPASGAGGDNPPPGPRQRGRLRRWGWRLALGGLAVGVIAGGWWLAKRAAGDRGALEAARALSLRQTEPVLHDPLGIDDPEGKALARIFSRLRALEEGETDRVAILQLGASHTTGQ